jgi:hypothetical protein
VKTFIRDMHRVLVVLVLFFFATLVPTMARAQFAACPAPSGNIDWATKALNLPEAWKVSCGTGNIAILDRGFNTAHAALGHGRAGNVRLHLSMDCRRPATVDYPAYSCRRDGYTFQSFDENTRLNVQVTASLDEYIVHRLYDSRGHGTAVMGIVGATPTSEFVGACRRCSVMMFAREDSMDIPPDTVAGMEAAIQAGAQVVNLSVSPNHNGHSSVEAAINRLFKYDIVLSASAGNSEGSPSQFVNDIGYPARKPGVFSIGGLKENPNPLLRPLFWAPEDLHQEGAYSFGSAIGTPWGAAQFLVAPARRVLSTFYPNEIWNQSIGVSGALWCRDRSLDSPPNPTPGYAICSGTSFSAPYVSALVGMVRSADPLLSTQEVRALLMDTAYNPDHPSGGYSVEYGWGIPDAKEAVVAALSGFGSTGAINRKTPLFGLYQDNLRNHVFTVVPQVAMAAIDGVLPPRLSRLDDETPTLDNSDDFAYVPVGFPMMVPRGTFRAACPTILADGYAVAGGCDPGEWGSPRTIASVLTTPANPITPVTELVPLYRMSWRCEAGCNDHASIRHFYSTDPAEIADREDNDEYHVDAIEGFVFPTTQSPTTGLVRLCRTYDSSRGGVVLFTAPIVSTPDSDCAFSPSNYSNSTVYSGAFNSTRWIGFVYPAGQVGPLYSTPTPTTLTLSSPSAVVVGNAFSTLTVTVRDQSGAAMSTGITVGFEVVAGGTGAASSLSSPSAVTNGSGVASVTATANTVAGTHAVIVTVSTVGTPLTASFPLTNLPDVAASVAVLAGSGQHAAISTAFSDLKAIVKDTYNNPVPGVTVTFTPPSSGASATLSPSSIATNASGIASVGATANATDGSYVVNASVTGIVTPAHFSLTNSAPGSIEIVDGSGQTALTGIAFANPLRVRVLDTANQPMSGISVSFQGPGSGASATMSPSSKVSDENGIAAVVATANATTGTYNVAATVSGVGTTLNFALTNGAHTATTMDLVDGSPQAAVFNTEFGRPLQVRVKDQLGAPLAGVTVTYVPPGSGASAVLSPGSAVTDGNGLASVTAVANATLGAYSVTATAGSISQSFSLTNTDVGFVNGSFESPTFATSGAVATGWASTSGGTYTNALLSILGVPNTTDGTQVGMYQTGFDLHQTQSLYAGSYRVTFKAIVYGATASVVKVKLDGVEAGSGTAVPGTWNIFTVDLPLVTTGIHTFAFGTDTANGSYVLIDAVTLVLKPSSNAFTNASFETPVAGGSLGPIATGWSTTYNAGVVTNTYLGSYGAAAVDGNQAGYFEAPGSLGQTVNLAEGFYTVSFSARLLPGMGYSPAPIKLMVNGVEQNSVTVIDSAWTTVTATFAAPTRGGYLISFANSSGSRIFVVDNVTLAAVAADGLLNGGFEMTLLGGGAAPSWTGGQGVNNGYLSALSLPTYPQGAQGLVYTSGSSVSQVAGFRAGDYTLRFSALNNGSGATPVTLRVDGVVIGTVSTNQTWQEFMFGLPLLTTGSHTIQIGTDSPNGTNVIVNDVSATLNAPEDVAVVNGGFEALDYAPNPYGWHLNGTGGTIKSSDLAFYGQSAAEGEYVEYFSQGSSLKQIITLAEGFYSVSFKARSFYYSSGTVKFKVDGVELMSSSVSDSSWTTFTVSVAAATPGGHTIEFTSSASPASNIMIDDVSIAKQ